MTETEQKYVNSPDFRMRYSISNGAYPVDMNRSEITACDIKYRTQNGFKNSISHLACEKYLLSLFNSSF